MFPKPGDRPGALDDATVERVIRVFTEQLELLGVNQEQLDRWRTGPLTTAQRQEVERLGRQVTRNHEVAVAILTLAEELSTTTIDAILTKSLCRTPLGYPDCRPSVPAARPPASDLRGSSYDGPHLPTALVYPPSSGR